MRTLVVYWTWSRGNTERIARRVAAGLNADIEKIEVAEPYAGNYDVVVEVGKHEIDAGTSREILPPKLDAAEYERVIVCTPTWWYTMAPAVKTYLSNVDLTGKTFAAIQTHAGWPGSTLDDMAAACPDARVLNGLAVQFASDGSSRQVTDDAAINTWIRELDAR